jgi:hypothetical protein
MRTKAFAWAHDERKGVEMRFTHLKTYHGFERLRGLSGARDEFHTEETHLRIRGICSALGALLVSEAAKGSSASSNPTKLSRHVAGFPPSPCLELVCPGRWASNQELGMSGRPVIHRAEIGARQDDLDLALANSDDQPVLRVVQDSASRFSRARAELQHGGGIMDSNT